MQKEREKNPKEIKLLRHQIASKLITVLLCFLISIYRMAKSMENFAEWSRSKRLSTEPPKSLFYHDCSYLGHCSFRASKDVDAIKTEASVYVLRLGRLIKSSDKILRDSIKQKFGVNKIRHLAHAISALYDHCLPDLGARSVYDCICANKAFTICVLKDNDIQTKEVSLDTESVYDSDDNLDTVEEFYEQPESIFEGLLSDLEDDEEDGDEEEEEEEENNKDSLSCGIKSFLENSKGIKFDNETQEVREIGQGEIPGLLSRLMACATIQRVSTHQMPGQDEWIVDLELMGVRKKYRSLGIGRYLINLIQDRNLVGSFDAIITSADMDAVKFYEKFDFSIDHILNSKYYMIGDNWTNTTKMCYVPPYSLPRPIEGGPRVVPLGEEQTLALDSPVDHDFDNLNILELTNMESEYRQWQKLMFSAYQNQAQMFARLKKEILKLKVKLSAKEGEIDELRCENQSLRRRNNLLLMDAGKSLLEAEEDLSQVGEPEDELEKLIGELKFLSKPQSH